MTTPEDFEQELAARLEQAGDAVAGEGTTLDGVIVRHRQRVHARRVRQGAVAAVAAGVLAVAGIGFAAGDEGGGTTQVAAEGSPATEGPSSTVAPSVEGCIESTEVDATFVVLLQPATTDGQRQAVLQALADRYGVAAVSVFSGEEAYQEARAAFGDEQPPTFLDELRSENVRSLYRVSYTGPGLGAGVVMDEVGEILEAEGVGVWVISLESLDGERVMSTSAAVAGTPPSTTTTGPNASPGPTVGAGNGATLSPEQVAALEDHIRSICDGATGPSPAAPPSSGTTTPPPPAPSTTGEPETGPPTTGPSTTTTVPAWPATTTPQHGGEVWAAYLAVVPQAEGEAAPDMRRLGDLARGLGYEPGASDLACDQGAAEALGLDPAGSYLGLPLYFATEDEARSFAERFRSEVRGEVRAVAQVRTFCLD